MQNKTRRQQTLETESRAKTVEKLQELLGGIKPEFRELVTEDMVNTALNNALKGCSNLDLVVAQKFSAIFCVKCGDCCRKCDPIETTNNDVQRASIYLGVSPDVFLANHCKQLKSGRWSLKSPCPFLGDNNLCSIYEARPIICHFYPFAIYKNKYVTLGIYPHCSYVTNFLAYSAYGEVLARMTEKLHPDFALFRREQMRALSTNLPSDQGEQIKYFRKFIDGQMKG